MTTCSVRVDTREIIYAICEKSMEMRIKIKETAKLICAALDANKESQDVIAARLKMNQSRVSCFRNGKFVRYGGALRRLCEYLKIEPKFGGVKFDPGKHKELITTLALLIGDSADNEKAVLRILKGMAKLGH